MLPTLVEAHKGSTSDDSGNYAPFSGAEQKVEAQAGTAEGVVGGSLGTSLGTALGTSTPLETKAFSLVRGVACVRVVGHHNQSRVDGFTAVVGFTAGSTRYTCRSAASGKPLWSVDFADRAQQRQQPCWRQRL